jgi:hypothetical protein
LEHFWNRFWNIFGTFVSYYFQKADFLLLMKIRRTFIIRWITASDRQTESSKSVIDVELVQTGEKISVSSLSEAQEWMHQVGLTPFSRELNSASE